jgi:hypothetical protein
MVREGALHNDSCDWNVQSPALGSGAVRRFIIHNNDWRWWVGVRFRFRLSFRGARR